MATIDDRRPAPRNQELPGFFARTTHFHPRNKNVTRALAMRNADRRVFETLAGEQNSAAARDVTCTSRGRTSVLDVERSHVTVQLVNHEIRKPRGRVGGAGKLHVSGFRYAEIKLSR